MIAFIIAVSLYIIGSYFLGAFPYMMLLARAKGLDFSHEPDLHLAVWRRVGRLWGSSGVAVDVVKGIIPVVVGILLQFPVFTVMLGGLAAMIGQMWPVFHNFDGEKGNTPGLGIMTGVSIMYSLPLLFIIGVIPLFTGFLVRTVPRFMTSDKSVNEKMKLGGPPSNGLPIGMLITFASFPLITWWLKQPAAMIVGFIMVLIMIVIRRMTADLQQDLKSRRIGFCRILLNRFLLDRSYW